MLIILSAGFIAGWLASRIADSGGLGTMGDVIVGVLGAFSGSWLLPRLSVHPAPGILTEIVNATIGALILLLITRLIRDVGWGRRW